ncbi:MAG: hypothetical protein IKN12_07675 [Selenomonadaceae bacterium]|nr:hypothetical protein [Selenomonadaceae bacterium]
MVDEPLSALETEEAEPDLDEILKQAERLLRHIGKDPEIMKEIAPEPEPETKEDEPKEELFYNETIDEDVLPEEDAPVTATKMTDIKGVELAQLENRYGRQNLGKHSQHGFMIEEVRTLSGYERSVLTGEDFVSPQFNLQFLYKVKSDIEREDLMENMKNFFANTPLIRVNFFPIGKEAKMHKIVFVKRRPVVNFYSLKFLKNDALERTIEKLMKDELKKPFDIGSDVLIRFTFIKAGEEDYAIIVTESRLLAQSWREDDFFSQVFGFKKYKDTPILTPDDPTFSMNMAKYYRNLMKDLPSTPKIPRFSPNYGKFTPKIYQTYLHPDLYKILKDKSMGNSDLMIAILSTAWGLLQKQVNYNRDTYFAILFSSYSLERNPQATASKIYPLPIRLTINDDATIKNITGRLLRQMLTGKSLGCTKMKYVLKTLGDPNELFPCYLHFHGFSQEQKDFGNVKLGEGYALLNVESSDAGRGDLNIYFDIRKEGLAITFRYNPYAFEQHTIRPLAKYFEIAVGCLLLSYGQNLSLFEEIYKENIKGWDRSFDSTYIM